MGRGVVEREREFGRKGERIAISEFLSQFYVMGGANQGL